MGRHSAKSRKEGSFSGNRKRRRVESESSKLHDVWLAPRSNAEPCQPPAIYEENDDEAHAIMETSSDLPIVHTTPDNLNANVSAHIMESDIFNFFDEHEGWEDAVATIATSTEADATLVRNELTVDQFVTNVVGSSDSVPIHRLASTDDQHSKYRISDETLKHLLKGKTMEALSFVIGNNGYSVVQYGDLKEAIRDYSKRLQERGYPSYPTLLYKSLKILRSAVFLRMHVISTEVDISRAGVQRKYVFRERDGEIPSTHISVVLPSEWGTRDVLLYDYMTSDCSSSVGAPTCTRIEYSLALSPKIRSKLVNTVHELFVGSSGYQTRRWITEGSRAILVILASRRCELDDDPTVSIDESDRRRKLLLHVTVGRTVYAEEENMEDGIHPCDAVTTLNATDGNNWRNAILIHKFSPKAGTRSLNICVDISKTVRKSFRVYSIENDEENSIPTTVQMRRSFGKLADSRSFAVFRCLLYTDDFKANLHRPGSHGGCYILPLGIPPWQRNGVHSIRIIGLTPAGVSSNVIINNIIEDIVRCSSEGVEVSMPDDTNVTLFLDVVGYIGDYQAMVHLLDVTGVSGLAPCNFCTFHRGDVSASDDTVETSHEQSNYAYSCAIHSGNLSYRRTKKRMEQWRLVADAEELQHVGLRKLSADDILKLPLHNLSNALEKVSARVPRLPNGEPVVPCSFDPYLNCIVAPDHLFLGVGQDITEAMLSLLSRRERRQVDMLATNALASAGFGEESSLLNSATDHIQQMTFSSFFQYLLVLPWAVRVTLRLEYICDTAHCDTENINTTKSSTLRALFVFQRLYMDTFYIPYKPVDGVDAVRAMEVTGSDGYISRLQSTVVEYMKTINNLCSKSEKVRLKVDKPNLHRLLEFFFHSLPLIGHAALFRELILESGHQPLKKGILKSNNQDAHNYSMMKVLAEEWKQRLGTVCSSVKNINQLTDDECYRLAEIAFGRGDLFQSGKHNFDEIRRSFPAFVLKKYSSFGTPSRKTRSYMWRAVKSKDNIWVGSDQTDQDVISYLKHFIVSNEIIRTKIVRYKEVALVRVTGSNDSKNSLGLRGRHSESKKLRRGCFVQLLLSLNWNSLDNTSGVYLLPLSSCSGIPSFWYVNGLYGNTTGDALFAHVSKMHRIYKESSFENQYSIEVDNERTFVVRLTEHIRRALALHNCICSSQNACHTETSSNELVHCLSDDENNNRWSILGTRDGFPPRRS